MKLDINFVRSQFPAFSEPSLYGWAFFENAGGSYPCKQVVNRLTDFYKRTKVQPYYPYPASIKAGELMDSAYERMAAYLNVDPSEVHFGPSTTQNVYVLANAMRPMWHDGDEIIVSCQDHEANAGAWRRLAERGIKVLEWHVDSDTGLLSVETLKKLMSTRTKMVAYPHCSNVIGQINPAGAINKIAHKHGAIAVIDGVGYAPHGFPDLQELQTDVYMFSTYKTFGPHLGMMYLSDDLMGKMENQAHFFKEGITRNMFTPAGPDHAQIASVNGILDYFDSLYEHHFKDNASSPQRNSALRKMFREHETGLLTKLLDFLRSRDDIWILGSDQPADRLPIVSVIPKNMSVMELYEKLTRHNLMLGFGHFYAVRPLMDMDIDLEPGVLRMSFVHYTNQDEIDQLINGLKKALN